MKLKACLLLLLMTLVPSSLFSNTLYFPQVAFGGGYSTTFVITNTGTTAVASSVNFYDQNGTPRPELSMPVILGPGNSTRFSLPNIGSGITVVWGQIAAGTGTVQGVATFDFRAPNGVLQTTVGVLGLEAGSSFLLPVDVAASASTGIAFANANAGNQVTVNLRLLDETGSQVNSTTKTLPARGQISAFVTELGFPQPIGTFRGTLVVDAGGGSIAATALTEKEGILSALPVIPSGGSVASAGKTVYFPQVAFGGGYTTTFVIMNTGTTSVSSMVNFYDQNGVSRPDLSRQVNVPVNGSTRFTIPNMDPNNITVVWGELDPGAGRTARGVATFDQRAPGGVLLTTAGVLGLEAGNSFNLPVDVTPSASTGVAIANANANAGVNVRLRLLGENAAEIATADEPTFSPLASRRQTADFVTKWFPQLLGTTFKGTLVVEALAGAPANPLVATALTIKEGILSALPVNPGTIGGSGGGGGTGGGGGGTGGGGGGGGAVVGGGPSSDCLVPSLYSSSNTVHLEYAFTGSLIGSVVQDTIHTPNVTFEGQSASEWATNQVVTYPALGTFPVSSKSYSRLEGQEFVSFGSTSETTTPFATSSKIVFSPPFRSKHYTLNPGESYTQTYNSITTSTLAGMPPTSTTSTVTHTERYLGQESVTVPAGTFNACKFEIGGLTSWEIVGKGITAKSVTVDTTGGTTTLSLTSGSINGSAIVP
jgi:hypothetical protein